MNKKQKLLLTVFLCIAFTTILFTCFNLYRYALTEPIEDLEYKKALLKDSHNITYTLEALRPVMGEKELTDFIRKNDSNPQIYAPDKYNRKNGIFRATLHTHTTNSDGVPTVEQRMNSAQSYAERHIKNGYMVIAITDHNTTKGAEEVIKVLESGKGKYNRIKVVLGLEINTLYKNSKIAQEPVPIHVLLWCINPYDKFLQKEFLDKDAYGNWKAKNHNRDFDWTISTMSEHGIPGPAHPARYTTGLKQQKYPYITEMLERYASLSKKTLFTEGYYQSYKDTSTGKHLGTEYDKYINHINNEAKKLNIIRTGSTDAHGQKNYKYR